MSTTTTWWLCKVTYAKIKEYFRILCKSFNHVQSNEKIWGEDGRDSCGREDHMLVEKKVILFGGRDRGVIKYESSFNTRSRENITSTWKRVNEI